LASASSPHDSSAERTTVKNGNHTSHYLQTTRNVGREEIVVRLSTHLRLPLHELLAVVCKFIQSAMSRSGLHRLLRRAVVNRVPEPEVTATYVKSSKAHESGYVHMHVQWLPQMQGETAQICLTVAIDPATRCAFTAIKSKKTAASARSPAYGLSFQEEDLADK
jgi:hypothetical protein